MTVLGQHTVAETRDLMRAIEFRVNALLQLQTKVKLNRQGPMTAVQTQLDNDIVSFVRNWIDVRDNTTFILTAAVLANPSVHPILLPAEKQYNAINDAAVRGTIRIGDLENRLNQEATALSLPPIDGSKVPPQTSADADFVALRKLDSAIATGEAAAKAADKAVGNAAKSNIGLIVAGGVVLVLGGGVLAKVYL